MIPVGVGGFSVDAGGNGVSLPLYTNVEEGELALFLLFICELYGGIDGAEVDVEVFELFISVWPYHECVIHVPDPHAGAQGGLLQGSGLEYFHEQVSYYWG